MDTAESGPGQSGYASAAYRHAAHRSYSRLPSERHMRAPPSMAAATMISPAVAYQHQPYAPPYSPSYGHGHGHAPPTASFPGMISPDEPRRPSNEADAAGSKQSLPSLSEVFSNNKKPSPYSPTTPTSMCGSQGLPPPPIPFGTAQPAARAEPQPEPRQFMSHDDKFARYPPRQDGPPGPHSAGYPYGEPRGTPKPAEPMPVQRGGNPPNPPPPQAQYAQPGHLPPGQLPLSAASPISPRQFGTPMQPYEKQRPPLPSDEEYGMHRRFDSGQVSQHWEVWGYLDSLKGLGYSGRTVSNFAESYHTIGLEQHNGPFITDRLPTSREMSEVRATTEYMVKMVESIQEHVLHCHALAKARENKHGGGGYMDDDVSMDGDGMKSHYSLGEVKKRRGRAAPPGRCHSCSRVDTPEWRRGPDGARTLCNACGLHWAKLERKKQMEAKSQAMRAKAGEPRVTDL